MKRKPTSPRRDPKNIIYDNVYAHIARGLNVAARLVAPTLGPSGGNVLHSNGARGTRIAPNAHTVLTEIDLSKHECSYVFAILKEAAIRMRKRVGDGIATMTLLADAIFSSARKFCDAYSPREIISSLRAAKESLVQSLSDIAIHPDPIEAIETVALTAGMDDRLKRLFIPLAEDLKMGAVILIDDDVGIDLQVTRVNGFHFTRGFASHYFVTDTRTAESVLKKCLVLAYEAPVNSVGDLSEFIKSILPRKMPLLIVSSDISIECISHLLARKQLKHLESCVVKTMGSERLRRYLLEDIALFTGGQAVFKESGVSLARASGFVGSAEEVRVDKDTTTIVGGAGSPSEIMKKITSLRKECADPGLLPSEVEDIQNRIMRLSGKVIRIRAGAPSTSEAALQKSRISAMIAASGSAIRTGLVPGCGIALMREAQKLAGKSVGGEILSAACRVPFMTILRNAGYNPHEIAPRLGISEVFDCVSGKFGTASELQIMDPLGIVQEALDTACSLASMFLDTSVILAQPRKYTHLGISQSTEELLRKIRA